MKNPIDYSLKTELVPFIILFSSVLLSFWSYPMLPDMVITHWGFKGEPNGWSPREFHCLLFPGLLFGMYLLLSLMPKFDPRGKRYEDFSGVYILMRNAILFVLFVVFVAATLANLGYKINIGVTVSAAIGILMIFMGNYFGKIKQNYFIGVRTPWTLASENVWNKTHRLGGRLFILWGLGLILAPWLAPVWAFIILFGGLIVLISILMIYSYSMYKKELKKGE